MKEHGLGYTKADGTPNQEVIYRSDFYDDMVAGVGRVMSMGAILSSPVVVGNTVYFGSADGNLYALREYRRGFRAFHRCIRRFYKDLQK